MATAELEQGVRGLPRGGHAVLGGAAADHRGRACPGSGRCSRAAISAWIIGKSRQTRRDFVALEVPPIVTREEPGRQFVLRADDLGSHDVGVPVYFRRLPVGEVVATRARQGREGRDDHDLHARALRSVRHANTRFWNASGIDVSLDATGVRVQTESLVSILVGGIAFQVEPDSAPEPPADANDGVHSLPRPHAGLQASGHRGGHYVLVFDGRCAGSPWARRWISAG